MVIAYVDDLIAVVEQEQLDGRKTSLDALHTIKTSGSMPAENQAGIFERRLKNNDMNQLKLAKSVSCVEKKVT